MSDALALVIELCGGLAEPHGPAVTVPIPAEGCAAGDLLERVAHGFPALRPLLDPARVRICLNETIVRHAALVRPGDTVALFPPVSGG